MFDYKTSVTTPYCDTKYYLASKYCPYLVQETAGRREAEYLCDIPHLLERENKSWVLLSTSFEYYKKPYWMRDITLRMEAFDKNRLMVPRRIICYDDLTKEKLFRCDCVFAVVGFDKDGKHRIVDPESVINQSPKDTLDMDDSVAPRFRKFDIDAFSKEVHTIKHRVLFTDCDINGHMNNLKYASWIISTLPSSFFENKDVKKFEICYTRELHLGDEVDIKYVDLGGGEFYSCISDACFAHILVDKIDSLGGPR